MQRVDPANPRQIDSQRRTRSIVHAATADPEKTGLTSNRQIVLPLDHRVAPGNRPFVRYLGPMAVMGSLSNAPDKKSFSSVS